MAANERYGSDEGAALAAEWAEAFPAAYRVDFEVEDALADIERFGLYEKPGPRRPGGQVLRPGGRRGFRGQRADEAVPHRTALALARSCRCCQNLGLEVIDERPFAVTPLARRGPLPLRPGPEVPGRDRPAGGRAAAGTRPSAPSSPGEAESDHFNRLVLLEGVSWRAGRAAARLRASTCTSWASPTPTASLSDTLVGNPDVTHGIIALFEGTFNPALLRRAVRRRGRRRPRRCSPRRWKRCRRWMPTSCCAAS